MVTITRNEISVEITNEEVIKMVQLAVMKHFNIGMSILKDKTRASISSYPRQIYWYFLKYQYGLKNSDIRIIDDEEYDSSAVTIQSEIVLLQKHYNISLKKDIETIREILTVKENYIHNKKLTT